MPVNAGDPVRIKAAVYNWAEAQSNNDRSGAATPDTVGVYIPAVRVRARNTSATLIDQYDTAELATVDLDPETVKQGRISPMVTVTAATWHASLGSLVVAAEPIPAGKIGWVVISGVTPARIDVANTDDRWASLDPSDPTRLRSSDAGEVRLFPPAATGARLCLIELGRMQIFWRYKFTANWAAAGTAAELYRLDETAYAASAAVTILDPSGIGLMEDQVTDDIGYCFQSGAKLYAIQAPCND